MAARRLISFDGVTDTITGWARHFGVSQPALSRRISAHGVEAAFAYYNNTRPTGGKSRPGKYLVTAFGETKPLSVWAKERNIPMETLRARLKRLPPELALTQAPPRRWLTVSYEQRLMEALFTLVSRKASQGHPAYQALLNAAKAAADKHV